jgi:hypothetical protein
VTHLTFLPSSHEKLSVADISNSTRYKLEVKLCTCRDNFRLMYLLGFLFIQKLMQKFVTMIVNKLKDAKLFASQGGPIILAQVPHYLP